MWDGLHYDTSLDVARPTFFFDTTKTYFFKDIK